MRKPQGCFFPLNAVAIHPQGTKKFCLTSTLPAEKDSDVFHQQRIEVHGQLAQGIWPESCRSCRRQESLGLQSRRIKTWERKLRLYSEDQLQSLGTNPTQAAFRHVEISFSNLCNLQCAMCSSEFSSSWIADDIKAVELGLEFREFTSDFKKVRRVDPKIIETILRQSHEIDLLIIKGGEPTRDPVCLEFLAQLDQTRRENPVRVFLQTNGTRHPSDWLPRHEGLRLEIGFSIDGWDRMYEWIRGTSFDRVIEHLLYLDEQKQVEALGIDFTLSVFNCFHFPEFLEKTLELKKRLKKLTNCAFFQWAQESYARPDSIDLKSRELIAQKAKALIESDAAFFLNSDNILKVLTLKQGDETQRQKARRWIDYVNQLRGQSLYEHQPLLQNSL